MTLHVFANFVTPFGTAANNRAETEGNITTLQKILWQGEIHSTVSAEAIRFALRRLLDQSEPKGANRTWNEAQRINDWKDRDFTTWASPNGQTYIDDDLLGFMSAKAASEEAEVGSANVRRGVLEVTRAVSLTPWPGDVTFNAASPDATASAQKRGANPVPYGTEVHATRYQYGIALTPQRLRDPRRAAKAIHALCHLGPVAGNHSRFLFDFSPDAFVLRITHDPAPRFLYCFDSLDAGKTLVAHKLLQRLDAGDIERSELIVGLAQLDSPLAASLRERGLEVLGVRKACDQAIARINQALQIQE